MYGQFLYFIIAIFIFAAYPGAEKTNFSPWISLDLFLFSWIFFIFLTRMAFKKIEKEARHQPLFVLDQKHDAAVSRQTIAAILFFAMDIYVLNLPDFLAKIYLFSKIPTLSAAACLCLFMCRMSIVWTFGHKIRQKLHRQGPGVFSHITSNLLLAAPVVLPWLILSLVSDILLLLPFNRVNAFLSTALGQVVYFMSFLFMISAVGPFFIQKLWQCKPLEPGYMRDRISRLCAAAGMPIKDILIWPVYGGKMITAGVMGLIKNFRYILITPSLLQLLDGREIDAVVAHEIGHIKKKHLLFYLLFFIGYLMVSWFLFRIFSIAAIYLYYAFDIMGHISADPAAMTSQMLKLAFNVMFIAGFILYFRFIFGFFIRNFERQADAYVYQFFESAHPLITTLEKIALAGGILPEKPNWHHFSIKERILFLLECEKDKTRIRRHDQTIKKGIALYVIGLAAVAGIESGLTYSQTGKNLNSFLYEKIIVGMLEKSPDDSLLCGELGDLYQTSGQYAKAVAAYETSLRLYPKNPAILNNLAWLLATCPEAATKNPSRALALALKAAGLESSPHILDTLAECYYINGLYEKALETGRKALGRAAENNVYYRSQIKKFESARINNKAH
jgi:Zn-dependent protease with chaperone function